MLDTEVKSVLSYGNLMFQGNDHVHGKATLSAGKCWELLPATLNRLVFLTHREEEIVKQHREVSNALRIKIDSLEQEKENVKEVTR